MAASNELLFYRRAIDGLSQAILLKVFLESTFTDAHPSLAVVPDSTAAAYDIGPRRILPASIDYHLLRDWIHFCTHNHKLCCKTYRPSLLPGFKVISIKTRQVVEADPDCTYLALSYVWGTLESTELNPSSYNLDSAPPVIQDAILVTGSLGYEYLWVDKYVSSSAQR